MDGQTLSTPDVARGVGEYLLNLLAEMVKIKDGDAELFLAVYQDYDRNAIAAFAGEVRIVPLGKTLETGPRPSRAYTDRIAATIEKYAIDVFWIPNPLMSNVNLIEEAVPCRTVATVYDLIPLVMGNMYLDRWPRDLSQDYLGRVSRLDRLTDGLLAISGHTGRDLAEATGAPPEKIKTIYPGSKVNGDVPAGDGAAFLRKYGTGRFLLYPGGFDPRKNMEKAALAFKKLVEEHGYGPLDLLIVCGCDADARETFTRYLRELQIDGRVKLTGYVPGPELLWLYDHASILFYPSLYEGFGLPVLEAMSRGVPVVAANRASLPEVVGDAGLLVDPDDADEMAEALDLVLSDSTIAGRLRARSRERARQFSWEKAAAEVLEALGPARRPDGRLSGPGRLKIAYFSPLPPQRTGVATYSRELLAHLGRYVDIDLFTDDGVAPAQEIRDQFHCYSYLDYEKRLESERYAVTLYHLGNSTFHEYIYKTLLKHPGIVVLHDYVLHPFIREITARRGDSAAYVAEMKYAYGPEGEKTARWHLDHDFSIPDPMQYPLNERALAASNGVIVHSHYVKSLIPRGRVKVIPHGRDPVDADEPAVREYKKELGLEGAWPLVGCYGFLNPNRRLEVLIEVFARIVPAYPAAKLLLAGDLDKGYRKSIVDLCKHYGLADRVILSGYLDEARYQKYMACADIVVNLRHPTMGETSGTLLDALALGRPTIVSNVGTYREVPDRCCWKVDVDGSEKALLEAYMTGLLENGPLREKMGRNAREYLAENHRWEKVASEYYDDIRGFAGIK